MFRHVKSFDKSMEKIVNIESDSFQSTIMVVTKVATEWEQKSASFLIRVEIDKP